MVREGVGMLEKLKGLKIEKLEDYKIMETI